MCRCYNKAVSVHREHIWSNDDYDWSVSSSYAIMYLFTPSVCPAIAVTFKTRVTNMGCSCHDWHIIIIIGIIFAGHHQLEDNNLLFAIQNFHASICLSVCPWCAMMHQTQYMYSVVMLQWPPSPWVHVIVEYNFCCCWCYFAKWNNTNWMVFYYYWNVFNKAIQHLNTIQQPQE